MSPNPDSVSTKHRGGQPKTSRRKSLRPKAQLAGAALPDGKLAGNEPPGGKPAASEPADGNLVSAEIYPHPKRAEPPAREERIRIAAYLLAEQRGFAPGHELEDWLAAEAQIDRLLAAAIPMSFLG